MDSSFFEMFDFELLRGDRASVLNAPNDFTISQSTAKRIFGDEDPIGKILYTDDRQFKITGVFKDFPEQSHLQFDSIGSIGILRELAPQWITGWNSISILTYVELAEGSTFDDFQDKIETMIRSFNVAENFNITAQPFTDVHMKSSHIVFDPQKGKSDITYIYAFGAIALFIIVIASFNFMNLSTARSYHSSRGGKLLRRLLVVLQFTISISLIIGTAIVYEQLNAGYGMGRSRWENGIFTGDECGRRKSGDSDRYGGGFPLINVKKRLGYVRC